MPVMSDSRNPFYMGSDRETGSFQSYNPGGQQQMSPQQQVQASQSRQLETQRRALQSMYHSEQMGVSTAEELVRQGEVLNRTEQKLDHIAAVQKDSQRHINNLSSVFGGIKNWWRRDSKKKSEETGQQQYQQPGQSLQGAMASSSSAQASRQPPPPGDFGVAPPQQQQQQQQGSSYDKAFNENLGEMSDGMSRLKQLALGLGTEIDRQNVQLERMGEKTDRTNVTMDKQNQDMNRILYGSKAGK